MSVRRLVCAVAFLSVVAGCSQPVDGPRHLVVIVADDLGWNDVGYHGSEIKTPHIDQLASDGLELDRFYAYPRCTPTRAAFLTGRSPLRYGLAYDVIRPWFDLGIAADERLLSETLSAAGFETALVGKWHLGHSRRAQHPNQNGFAHFYGCLTGAIGYFDHKREEGGLDWQRNGESVHEPDEYATDLITAEAVRVIREHDSDDRLFLYVSFTAPHTPIQAPAELRSMYEHLDNPLRATFAAMVTALDSGVGSIRRALDDAGMSDDTVLVFFSDNGAMPATGGSNQPLRGGKATAWEGAMRTPAVFLAPGQTGSGRSERVITVADLHPTLLGVMGVEYDGDQPRDGVDRSSGLANAASGAFDPLVIPIEDRTALRFAAYEGPWKLVQTRPVDGGDWREALFDVFADPGEQTDQLAEQPDVAERLRTRIAEWENLRPRDAVRFANRPPSGWRAPSDWSRMDS